MPVQRHRKTADAPRRYPELDGLRGIAALMVVGHHVLLVIPAVADAYLSGIRPEQGSMAWYLTYTPLRLFVSGPEAVLIFFVLSGLVVALPVLRSKSFEWVGYYVSRVLRLGVPVVAAVILAALLRTLTGFPEHPSAWVNMANVPDMTWRQVFAASDLIAGDYVINNPLWSLRWEMVFSLSLPVYVAIAATARSRRALLVLVASATLVSWAAHSSGNETFVYLPVFLLGTALARLAARTLGAGGERRGLLIGCGWLLLFTLSALVLILPWLTQWAPTAPEAAAIIPSLPPLGAMGIVWCTLRWRPLRALLSSGPARIAGRYSFSLYLVHVPAIYLTLSILPGRSFRYVAPAAILIAFALCAVFYHLVEAPGHRLARRVGKRAAAEVAQFTAEANPDTSAKATAEPSFELETPTYADGASSSRASASNSTGIPPRTG